ncbi:RagB/SusD family nutrient uptake outer membrane protein [Flavobacterium sp.]|uniref:RagB/SusD family nutrient uptake outer membrane protein n=1 Tax=Flavobacterium sp. TaxID=239 RepID=UPI003C3B68DC
MKRFNYKYLIILAVGILGSCNEDYLAESNPNLIASENYWKDLTDTNKGLTAAYSALLDENALAIATDALRSDMGWPGYGRPTPTSKGESVTWYSQTYNNSTAGVIDHWNACYKGIYRANQVIEALNNLKTTGVVTTSNEKQWVQQMAEARFLRGLFHFYLHSSYNNGEIIIRDFVPKIQDDLNTPLSTSQQVITFFRDDLKYAFDNLDFKPAAIGRATKGAAATILGTSHLYENEIDLAKGYFNDIITNSSYGYELVTDMSLLFTTKGEFNKESIFEIEYNNKYRLDINNFDTQSMVSPLASYTTNTGDRSFFVPAWIAYAYKTEEKDIKDDRNYYLKAGVKTLRNVPLRASAMITLVEDEQTPYYASGTVSDNIKTNGTQWGFSFYKKYSNHDILATSENDLPINRNYSGKNVIVNRLADVYLMQAECLIKSGDNDGAIKLINKIRARWALKLIGPSYDATKTFDGITYTPGATGTLMKRLMEIEKPLEMSVEGHAIRFNDLRRWGLLVSNFQKLADATYYVEDYTFVNSTTLKNVTKKFMSVVTVKGIKPSFTVDFEYDISLSNFNIATQSYLPIPYTELTTNTALQK